jgi:hypothetical protein
MVEKYQCMGRPMSRDEIETVCYEWQVENKFESWAKVWGQLNKTGLRFIWLKLHETNTTAVIHKDKYS